MKTTSLAQTSKPILRAVDSAKQTATKSLNASPVRKAVDNVNKTVGGWAPKINDAVLKTPIGSKLQWLSAAVK